MSLGRTRIGRCRVAGGSPSKSWKPNPAEVGKRLWRKLETHVGMLGGKAGALQRQSDAQEVLLRAIGEAKACDCELLIVDG